MSGQPCQRHLCGWIDDDDHFKLRLWPVEVYDAQLSALIDGYLKYCFLVGKIFFFLRYNFSFRISKFCVDYAKRRDRGDGKKWEFHIVAISIPCLIELRVVNPKNGETSTAKVEI